MQYEGVHDDIKYAFAKKKINLDFLPHIHSCFEVLFVTEGQIACEVSSEKKLMNKGDIILILPHQIHSYRTSGYSETFTFVFSCDLVSGVHEYTKGKRLLNPVIYMENSCEMIDILAGNKNLFFKQAILHTICAMVLENSELADDNQANPELIAMLVSYVQTHFKEEVSLKKLAMEWGYNYTYLSNLFHKSLQQNFSTYLRRFRLDYAVSLLRTTDKTITEIALESGFNTIRNFNIAFKETYSIPPSEYRKSKK